MVSLGLNGTVRAQGTDISDLLANDPGLASEVEEEKKALEETKTEEAEAAVEAPAHGKLVVAEEIVEGHITWKSISLLISALGGKHPVLFILFLVGCIALGTTFYTAQTWFLGEWGAQYETHAPSEVNLYLYASFDFLFTWEYNISDTV